MKARREVTSTVLQDMWRIWFRFDSMNLSFALSPSYTEFLRFHEFPDRWYLDEYYNFAALSRAAVTDRSSAERDGDALVLSYRTEKETTYATILFEYFKGEQYMKYKGWKRVFGQLILYESPVLSFNVNTYRSMMADIAEAWVSSHVRRRRDEFLERLVRQFPSAPAFYS